MHGKRVLVVEDNDQIRVLLGRCLVASGFEVSTAQTGAAAIRLLEGGSALPEVVISDYALPGASGLKVCETAMRRNPGTKVLLISGDPDVVRDAQAPGGFEFPVFEKPFSPWDIVHAVEDLVGVPHGR